MNRQWAEQGYVFNLQRISRQYGGIERIVGVILYVPCLLQISYGIDWLLRHRSDEYRIRAVEYYVVAVTLLAILNWSFGPNCVVTAACSYFSASTVISLLQVVFLHRIFGEMHSTSRSLILLICNVVQIVFMYAAWYHLEINDSQVDMLFEALLVLATIGHPHGAPKIVELQIVTNFTLLVVFLNHLVSRLAPSSGVPEKGSGDASRAAKA
jgi:hypothetical protein